MFPLNECTASENPIPRTPNTAALYGRTTQHTLQYSLIFTNFVDDQFKTS